MLDDYALALSFGATGIESKAWSTADGVVVLHDRDSLRGGLRRRLIAKTVHGSLPTEIFPLEALYERCGSDFDLALDVADGDTAAAAIRAARSAGGEPAIRRLWLIHSDWECLGEWREQWADVRLVNRAKLRGLRLGPERRAAQLSAAGIDAALLHHSEWTGGLTTLFHRFERLAFAAEARHDRIMRNLVRMGIDGMSSDQIERMVGALRSPGSGRP